VRALTEAVLRPEMSRYPFQLGLPAFREAVSAWMQRRFGVPRPVPRGAAAHRLEGGIAHIAFAYVGAGDVTVFPDPGYLPYLGGTLLAGGEPHACRCGPENEFLIPLEDIPGDVARRTRILYLNYPNNPTAAIAPRRTSRTRCASAASTGRCWCTTTPTARSRSTATVRPSILEIDGAMDVAVEFHSFSKTYNMTGWRIGWAPAARTPSRRWRG
jgi:LL-diaminopimelate aminotransferase